MCSDSHIKGEVLAQVSYDVMRGIKRSIRPISPLFTP